MKIDFKKITCLVFILLTIQNCGKKGKKSAIPYPLALLGGQNNSGGPNLVQLQIQHQAI